LTFWESIGKSALIFWMSNMVLFRKILNTKVAKMELLIAKQILIF